MRKFLLLTTLLTMGAVSQAASLSVVTPGSGSLTDSNGQMWTISPSGSVKQGDQWTPGGGGTSRLTIISGVVYGEDSSGRGWFALNGPYWRSVPAPAGMPTAPVTAAPSTPTAAATPVSAPSSVPAIPASVSINTCSNYTAINGQFYGLDNKVFVPKGVNVPYGGMNPSAATILAAFPHATIVRLPIYHNESGAALKPYVDDLTNHGLVVLIEDHHDNNASTANSGGAAGTIFSGNELNAQLAWHIDISKTFINNPRVWQASKNEPPEAVTQGGPNNAAALSAWQLEEYKAVRGTGNNNVFLFEVNSWGPGQTANGYDLALYAQADNAGLDVHWYGWVIPDQIGGHASYGMDPAVALATLKSMVSEAQQIKGNSGYILPVWLGELGNSTTGVAIDQNWVQVLNSAFQSGLGYGAWAWGVGPGDKLTDGDQPSNGFGTMIAADIAKSPVPGPAVGCAGTPVAATTPSSVVVATGPVTTPAPEPVDPATLSATAISDQAIANSTAARTAIQAQIQQTVTNTNEATKTSDDVSQQQTIQTDNADKLLQSILGDIHQ